jgi:ribose transport system permease protein
MKKILGIFSLLIIICLVTTVVEPQFVAPFNLENLIRWTALFGIISIGVAFVIITGGIDLSIGSVIGLTGCLLPLLLAVEYVASGDVLTVEEIAPKERTVTVSPADFGLIHGDRLEFRSAGRARRLTVEDITPEESRLVLRVRESPAFLDSGDQATVSYLNHMSVPLAFGIVMLISAGIGLTHGLLITKLRLQPFVVTLCGLLFYRGLARVLTGDNVQGFGTGFEGLKYLAHGRPFSIPVPFLRWISDGNWSRYQWNWQKDQYAVDAQESLIALPLFEWIAIPMPIIILVVIALAAGVFLNLTIYGRYLLALGRNEQAARYSGIHTDRMVVLAYVICSALAGLAGMLFALDLNSVQPSGHGNFYELYAIAAAVLGGCSLRGGEGSILGVVIGAAVMRVLYNSINLMKIPTQMEFAIIGLVILAGVIVDELVKRYAARRRARRSAAAAEAAAA